MNNRLRGTAALAACLLAVTLTACGGSAEDEHAAHNPAEHAAATGQDPAAAGAAPGAGGGHGGHGGGNPGELELWAVGPGPLGVVVTETTGMIVYRSDKDTNAPPTSNCDLICAQTWTPLVSPGKVVGMGVTNDKIGTLTRADGSQQVTIAGWPAYTHVGDSAGDTTVAPGNGADGVWFVMSPTGEKAAPPA